MTLFSMPKNKKTEEYITRTIRLICRTEVTRASEKLQSGCLTWLTADIRLDSVYQGRGSNTVWL